ncbi:MAG: glucose-6-phosphate dehydrogenase assembly protein OpcA [Ktedonobacterales bacterium]
MTVVYDPFASMRPVELGHIESELDIMWRETNAHISASGAQAVSRNSVLTLVVYTTGRSSAGQLLEVIHTLNSQHPSRAIIISADPQQKGDRIQAHIATYVNSESNSYGDSYGEDIVLDAETEAVKHLPGVILPLIISGLPSFLWWSGEPPWGSELLESLVDGSDRLIVDIAEMYHIELSLSAMDHLVRRKSARCAISDTSWTAQTAWRELVAQFFDMPHVLPYLGAIERLSVEFAAGDEDSHQNSGQAYLFAGWLASRLGWKSQQAHATGLDANRQHALRDANGRAIALEINPRFGVNQRNWWEQDVYLAGLNPAIQPDSQGDLSSYWVRPGALMSVHIVARLEGKRATFTVGREQDLGHATTLCHVPGTVLPSQTIHLDSVGEREPISAQLRNLGHDQVYEEALATAHQLAGSSERHTGS